MKKLTLSQIFLLLMLISCSKSKKNEIATDQIVIVEHKTNSPLASVRLDLYRCTNYDNIFGCVRKNIFATRFTNNSGMYTFMQGERRLADQGMVVHKDGYWPPSGASGDTLFMSPEGWIDLHLSRQHNYPDTSLFRCIVTGEYPGIETFITFQSPADTVLKVRGFGNETNTINWLVIAERTSYPYGTDTLATGILTQNLDKFGTTSLPLSY